MPSLDLIRESIEARIARRAANDLAAGRACHAARQHRDTDPDHDDCRRQESHRTRAPQLFEDGEGRRRHSWADKAR